MRRDGRYYGIEFEGATYSSDGETEHQAAEWFVEQQFGIADWQAQDARFLIGRGNGRYELDLGSGGGVRKFKVNLYP